MKRLALASTSLLLVVAVASLAQAAVTRVDITSRVVVADGQWFGAAGPYEKIAGTVYFEVDPAEPHNAVIADAKSRIAARPTPDTGGFDARYFTS